jgi:hypothetical protein
MVRHFEGGVAKEGVDCRQAQVAGSDANAVVLLYMVQIAANQRSSDVLEAQFGWMFVQALLDEVQQLTEGIAIRADGMRAHLALLHQPA